MTDKALVVLSGGQDSTTCLYWAINRFGRDNVSAVTFDYGQRHRIELQCAADVAADAGIPHTVLPIDTFNAIGGNALTDDIDVRPELDDESGLPNTFVPGRNLIFLTYAAALAWKEGVSHLVTGVAQTDYSGYPGLPSRDDRRAAEVDQPRNGIRIRDPYAAYEPVQERNRRTGVESGCTCRDGIDTHLLQRRTSAMRQVPGMRTTGEGFCGGRCSRPAG